MINKVWDVQKTKYHLAIKGNETRTCTATKMNSERTSNKGPCISFIWNLQDRQAHRERQQFGVCVGLEEWGNCGGGGGAGGDGYGVWVFFQGVIIMF